MISLCKNGLPSGNLFEYAAYTILEYEKKWKQIKSKEKKEMVSKYWEEKGGKDKDKGKKFLKILVLIHYKESFNQLNRSLSHVKSEADIDATQRSQSEKKIKDTENRSKNAEKEKDISDRSKSQTNKKDKLKSIFFIRSLKYFRELKRS